jgi:hypothetical protein
MVLSFADPKLDPSVAYFDIPVGGVLVDDAGQVVLMEHMFADVASLALPLEDSREMISTIRDEFHAREVADV